MALLALPAARWAIGAAVALMVVLGGLAWIRHDAAADAEAHLAARAAHSQERTRHEADAAARDADRDGADRRLRSGDF
ncbi:hypothetical protein KTR66_04750 [Roseococcus sp. SDR]|uniref:hypothetical protein n=1 Tax=Roseococcus sp. SDR TaxID=2835532 RepID=UPI001BCF880E|nr:hypothetical protein [Roseococcus sp. SDR]MBS7789289.1 hypothetical protein [Roseococcus sp. SDR]MBV1844603.1 hypothetical protein [Roseococcus sp. SDR]